VAGATAAGGSSGGTTSSGAATVAGLPSPAAVLEAMHRANNWFVGAHPDPTADIVTNKARPSNLWTRAAYYEGLMALYNVGTRLDQPAELLQLRRDLGVEPDASVDHDIHGGRRHDARRGQPSLRQIYIDLYNIDKQDIRIQEIKANIDDMVAKGNTDAWWWIDAIQMAMPSFAKLGVLENDTKYFDAMWGLYNSSRTQQGGGLWNPKVGLWWPRLALHAQSAKPTCGGTAEGPEAGAASGPDGGVTASPDGSTAGTDARVDARANANTDGSIDVSVAPGPDSGSDASGDGGDGGTVVSDWSVKQTIVAGMTLPAQTQDSYIVTPSGKDIYWSRGNGWVFVAWRAFSTSCPPAIRIATPMWRTSRPWPKP